MVAQKLPYAQHIACLQASRAHSQSFELDLKGEGSSVRLACDKTWDDMPRLEGRMLVRALVLLL